MHPRKYLSYSQLILWEYSPEAYFKQYLDKKRRGTNRGMALGKEVATALETDEETGDFEKDAVIAMMPKYEIRDQEMFANLTLGDRIVPILIKIDSLKADYSAFYEVKTGAGPWTQAIVDKDDQITFYATGLYNLSKKIPEAELIWAPTRKEEDPDGIERPHLTGQVIRFKTKRTKVDILKMQARMSRAWREIGEAMEAQVV